MTAAVVGNATVAMKAEKDHLVLPGIGAQRPAVAEDYGPPRSPVLVIDLSPVADRDRVVCFRTGGGNGHDISPFVLESDTNRRTSERRIAAAVLPGSGSRRRQSFFFVLSPSSLRRTESERLIVVGPRVVHVSNHDA